ncbi:hypothetical protein QFZ25_000175 [Bacillus atrophaeus]|nr:hypothetical protein S101359_00290 [Bacillus atrophaeus]MDQ0926115.1 hypothetical protein [Bacillus atrophaeus]
MLPSFFASSKILLHYPEPQAEPYVLANREKGKSR